MRIDLRIASADLGSIENITFKPKSKVKMTLLPLPPKEWVGEQTCSLCGGKPDFLQESMQPICRKCINNMFTGLTKKQSTTETSVPITMEVVTHIRFEWSTDGEKWYSLAGKNIKVEDPNLFLNELKKSILEKRPMNVEADYIKEDRALIITL